MSVDVPPSPTEVDSYNYVLGTQTIGARYGFTGKPILVETAEAILNMGSNLLKICPTRRSAEGKEAPSAIETITDLVSLDETYRTVLDMPFTFYHIWANCLTPSRPWTVPGFTPRDADLEYEELRGCAEYLLRTYSGTGKVFYLGHWEGDWLLLQKNFDLDAEPTEEAIRLMIDGLNLRQKAVDDAKRTTDYRDVEVFHYTEANQVQKSFRSKKSLASSVLPEVNVDFVSYSAYDSTNRVLQSVDEMRSALHSALDYLQDRLQPKPVEGSRVWIGEYGLPLEITGTPGRQNELCSAIARAGLEWGARFILYWEMYNNEVVDGRHRGFWMIDNKGEKQPVYHTHRVYYERARTYVEETLRETHRLPEHDAFCRRAVELLDSSAQSGASRPAPP